MMTDPEINEHLRHTKLEPPAQVKARLVRFGRVARDIAMGLYGEPFVWRAVDAQHKMPLAQLMGITLISKSRAERLGFTLKRGAQPVGRRYFEAPISAFHDVYVLECQFNRMDEA